MKGGLPDNNLPGIRRDAKKKATHPCPFITALYVCIAEQAANQEKEQKTVYCVERNMEQMPGPWACARHLKKCPGGKLRQVVQTSNARRSPVQVSPEVTFTNLLHPAGEVENPAGGCCRQVEQEQ